VFASVSISRTCGTNDGHDFSADFLCVDIIEYESLGTTNAGVYTI
jgi:hypothetical protein